MPYLLIHGLSGTSYEVQYLGKELSSLGLTLRIPTLPGHGSSTRQLSHTRWQDWCAVVASEFETLQRTHKTVSVAGLCMGAVLALHLAADKKHEVQSLTLLSTTLFFDGWALPWYRFLLPLAIYTPLRYFYSLPEREPYGVKNRWLRSCIAQAMGDASRVAYSKTPVPSIHEMAKLISVVKPRLAEVSAPTLIIHAQKDDIASLKNAAYLESNLGSQQISTVILKDSYHLVTIDNERARVANCTGNFVLRHGDPGFWLWRSLAAGRYAEEECLVMAA